MGEDYRSDPKAEEYREINGCEVRLSHLPFIQAYGEEEWGGDL